MSAQRMPRSLVALSAAAISAVYAAGYVQTRTADAQLGASGPLLSTTSRAAAAPAATPIPTPLVLQRGDDGRPANPFDGRGSGQERRGSAAPPPPPPNGGPGPAARGAPAQQQPQAPPTAQAPATAAGATTTAYRDGTFNGMGTSRRGNVWVAVTVQGGRIASVEITRSTLQYPVRVIEGLPGQVTARQGPQVDAISGATYSVQAFRTAVQQALSQAA